MNANKLLAVKNFLAKASTVFRGKHYRSIDQLFLTLCLIATSQVFGDNPVIRSCSGETFLVHSVAEMQEGVIQFFFENKLIIDIAVTVEMNLDNLEPDISLPATITLSPKETRRWITLTKKDFAQGWTWTNTYTAIFGSTTAEHNDRYMYAFPYAPGESFRVSQTSNGRTHYGENQFAIDWAMPTNTPIHASRGGTVVWFKDNSDTGGDDPKYDGDANYVLIEHIDRTLGEYAHLRKGGVVVAVGQRVRRGDLIGYSGNTGYSSGPHLHLSVFKSKDGKCRQSIPIRFLTDDNVPVELVKNRYYTALPRRATPVTLANVPVAQAQGSP